MKPVKYIDPPPNNLSGKDWRILGELELPVAAEANGVVSAWLTKILNPINLHTDFLSKVTKSAQDAAIRAIASERPQMEFEHIHLRIFLLRKKALELNKEQTWGFFRIEKGGTPTANMNPYDHSIEFYLYLEG